MPFPLLAHQAPVLPLKMWRPSWFSGTALVIGSMAPDLQYFWTSRRASPNGHTVLGQFIFCLPITMSLVLVIGHLRLGAVVCDRVGRRVAWIAEAAHDVTQPRGILRAMLSALIGSFSHVALDKLTHDTIPLVLPQKVHHIGVVVFYNHAVVQAAASIIGAIATLAILTRISYRDGCARVPRRRGVLVLAFGTGAGGGLGVFRALPAIHHPDWFFEAAPVYIWGYVTFLVIAGAFLGTIIAATFLAKFDRTDGSAKA